MMRAMRFGVGVLAVLGGLAIGTPDTVARDLRAATLHGRSRASFASRREPEDAARLRGSSLPEIYLLRGLFNLFSLGMDDLAAKLQEQGFSAIEIIMLRGAR